MKKLFIWKGSYKVEWLKSFSYWIVVSPVLIFIITRMLLGFRDRKGTRATKYACDSATIFLIVAIPTFCSILFQHSYLLYFILFLLLLAVSMTFFYAKKEGEINYQKLFVLYWRVLFLLLVMIYLCLYVYAICFSLYSLI